MAIKRVFNGATIRKPGAYSSVKVENLSGFPLQATGTVGIIGEAVGGEADVLDILERSQIQSAKARYKSGPIADALSLLSAPSSDPRVANGASTIIVYKTNVGTMSSLALDDNTGADMIDLISKNYGADENQVNIVVSEGSVADADAAIAGTIDGPFVLGGTLAVVVNGTEYTYTCGMTGATGATGSAAEYLANMNLTGTWSPSKPVVTTQTAQKLSIAIDTTALATAKLDRGYIDVQSDSTLDTVLGLAGSNRGVKGSRYLTITKGTSIEDAEEEIGGVAQINIRYSGSAVTCLLEIKDVTGERKLETTCAAVAADDLDMVIARQNSDDVYVKVMSLQEIINAANATGKYVATLGTAANGDTGGEELDYTNAYIETVSFAIKRDAEHLVQFLNLQSQLVDAERKTNVYGALKLEPTAKFLSGGTDGVSSNTTYANGFEALETVRCNVVVPLISADDGAVTIASVNALAKSHVIKMWSTTGRSERNAYVSLLGTKAALKAMAKSMASAYVSICGQDPLVYSESQKAAVYLDPWAQACIKAGMQAGSEVGEPTTFKIENVMAYRVRDGSWDPKIDYEEMIESNVMISEPLDAGGWRDVVGNTTYGVDSNFVWNRVSVVEAAGFVAYDLRYNLEAIFTGTKSKTGTAASIASLVASRMEIYLKSDITVGDDTNDGLGFKDLSVQVTGNTAEISVTITPVQGIDFILPTIYLADIRQSA
jgi:hypothetical protein